MTTTLTAPAASPPSLDSNGRRIQHQSNTTSISTKANFTTDHLSNTSSASSSTQASTMREVLASIPGFSVKPRRRTSKKMSTAAQIEQTKDGKIDLETPDSILSSTNLRALLNKTTFSMLPPLYQYNLIQLLPSVDRKSVEMMQANSSAAASEENIKLGSSSLNNEFFARACLEWRERLTEGEFTPENQVKLKSEAERERSKLDPWKLKHFEPIWGEKSTNRLLGVSSICTKNTSDKISSSAAFTLTVSGISSEGNRDKGLQFLDDVKCNIDIDKIENVYKLARTTDNTPIANLDNSKFADSSKFENDHTTIHTNTGHLKENHKRDNLGQSFTNNYQFFDKNELTNNKDGIVIKPQKRALKRPTSPARRVRTRDEVDCPPSNTTTDTPNITDVTQKESQFEIEACSDNRQGDNASSFDSKQTDELVLPQNIEDSPEQQTNAIDETLSPIIYTIGRKTLDTATTCGETTAHFEDTTNPQVSQISVYNKIRTPFFTKVQEPSISNVKNNSNCDNILPDHSLTSCSIPASNTTLNIIHGATEAELPRCTNVGSEDFLNHKFLPAENCSLETATTTTDRTSELSTHSSVSGEPKSLTSLPPTLNNVLNIDTEQYSIPRFLHMDSLNNSSLNHVTSTLSLLNQTEISNAGQHVVKLQLQPQQNKGFSEEAEDLLLMNSSEQGIQLNSDNDESPENMIDENCTNHDLVDDEVSDGMHNKEVNVLQQGYQFYDDHAHQNVMADQQYLQELHTKVEALPHKSEEQNKVSADVFDVPLFTNETEVSSTVFMSSSPSDSNFDLNICSNRESSSSENVASMAQSTPLLEETTILQRQNIIDSTGEIIENFIIQQPQQRELPRQQEQQKVLKQNVFQQFTLQEVIPRYKLTPSKYAFKAIPTAQKSIESALTKCSYNMPAGTTFTKRKKDTRPQKIHNMPLQHHNGLIIQTPIENIVNETFYKAQEKIQGIQQKQLPTGHQDSKVLSKQVNIISMSSPSVSSNVCLPVFNAYAPNHGGESSSIHDIKKIITPSTYPHPVMLNSKQKNSISMKIFSQPELSSTIAQQVSAPNKTSFGKGRKCNNNKLPPGAVNLERSYQICQAVIQNSPNRDNLRGQLRPPSEILSQQKQITISKPAPPSALIKTPTQTFNVSIPNASGSFAKLNELTINKTVKDQHSADIEVMKPGFCKVVQPQLGFLRKKYVQRKQSPHLIHRLFKAQNIKVPNELNITSQSHVVAQKPQDEVNWKGSGPYVLLHRASLDLTNNQSKRASSAPPVPQNKDQLQSMAGIPVTGRGRPASVDVDTSNLIQDNVSIINTRAPVNLKTGNITYIDELGMETGTIVSENSYILARATATTSLSNHLNGFSGENPSLSSDFNDCICSMNAMVICQKCGAFCHNECISLGKLCISCAIQKTVT